MVWWQLLPRHACQPLRQRLAWLTPVHFNGWRQWLLSPFELLAGWWRQRRSASRSRAKPPCPSRRSCSASLLHARQREWQRCRWSGLLWCLSCAACQKYHTPEPCTASPHPNAPICLCRRAPSASGAPQAAKRKLLPISSSFRLPGDAVPAHMMFAAKAPRLGGEAKPTASGLSSQL